MGTASAQPNTVSQTNASMCAVQAHGLAPIGDGPPGPADFSTACSCNAIVSSVVTVAPTVVVGMNSDGSLWSATETVSTVTNPAYTPPTDCCVECLITAADVQILYWPVETVTPNNVSTANNLSITAAPPVGTPYSYVEHGMTFISPSVYVAYRSLGAAENCPAFGPKYFGQGNATDVTIGYAPDALSTSMCNGPPAGFQLYTAINYTELQYPTGAQTRGTCEWRIGSSGTPRGPYLSIPTDINNVNPAWKTCKGAFEGSFDPPSALRKATAMVAPTLPPDKSPSATPGPSIAPVNAPPTAVPVPVDPGSGGPSLTPGTHEPAKPNTPISNPGNADPGNAGSTSSDPAKPANPPASPNNGSPAAPVIAPNQAPSQNGGSGSSDPLQNSNPTNSHPASGNGGSNPETGAGSESGSGSGAGSGTGSGNGSGTGSSTGSGNGSGTGSGSGSGPGTGSDPNSGAGSGTAPAPNSVVANGNTVYRDPNGGVVVGSSTVMPGNTAQVAGAPLSVGPDHIVIGSSSYALPAATTAGAVLVGSSPIVKASAGGVVIGSSTIAVGAQTAVDGHTVSVGSSHAVVDGSTYALPASAGAVVQATQAPSPLLVGSQSVVKALNGGVVIGSSTIAPGAHATFAGHTVSVGSSAVIIDETTHALPSSPGTVVQGAPASSPVLVAGQSIVAAANGGIVIAGSTIAPGAQATIAGHAVSVGSSTAVIDGTTYALPSSTGAVLQQAPNLAQNLALSSKVTLANGAVVTAGGAPATVDGTVIAIASDDSGLIVNGKKVPLPTAAPSSVFTIAGQTFTAAPTGFAVAGQSLSPGGSAITLSGTVLSLGPSGLQIGTATVPLPPTAAASVFTVAGQTFTAAPIGFTFNGQTISPGGSAITISGTIISLGPSGLQIGTSTIPLPSPPTSVFTVAGQTFTAAPTGFAINGQTLSLGGSAITFSGTLISLGPAGLQIGTSTVPLSPAEQSAYASASASAGLGGLIMGGYGSNPTGVSNSSGLVGFTGAGSRVGVGVRYLAMLIALGIGMVGFVL